MAKTGDNSNLGRSSADVQFNRCSGLLGNGKVQDVVVENDLASNNRMSIAEMTNIDINSYVPTIADDLEASTSSRLTYSWNKIWVTTPAQNSMSMFKSFKANGQETGTGIKTKQLLKNVYGSITSGELVCILGASGAGKTTLLNTLTFRNGPKIKLITGDRFINGKPVNAKVLSTISSYIQQEDLFVGTLTVREHLKFHARLRMHPNISYQDRMKKVEQVIDEFGLRKCVDTLIGIPGRLKGLSGGEQKRLAFAAEILTDPTLMFCDEPISGLDSFMAQNIIQCLKTQAEKGKAILCTIHQPSSALFTLFDRLLVMSEGRVAYFGPTSHVLKFMEEQGYPCPLTYNPAEFLTETLATHSDNMEEGRIRLQAICEGFEKTEEYKELKKVIEVNCRPTAAWNFTSLKEKADQDSGNRRHYKGSWFAQFFAVFWRSWIAHMKDPAILRLRIVQTIGLALCLGLIGWQQGNNQDAITNINSILFMLLLAITHQTLFGVIDVICADIPLFLREHWNGMYRTDVYYLGVILAGFPIFLISTVVVVTTVFYATGLHNTMETYLNVLLTALIFTAVSSAFGYFLSCLSSTVKMALILAPLFVFPSLVFSGFLMKAGSGPIYLRWVRYYSLLSYSYENLVVAQWQNIDDIPCTIYNGTCLQSSLTNGEMVLDEMGFKEANFTFNLTILGMSFVGYHLLGYLCLLKKTFRRN